MCSQTTFIRWLPCHYLVRLGISIARSKCISSASVQPFGLRCRERE
jgi:hypothetical protein